MVNYQILNLQWELLLGKEGGLGWAIGYICDVLLFNLGCGHVGVLLYFLFCFCSITQSCLTLCDPMNCSMPGFPVLYHLLEFAQTHAHWVDDAIQPSHPLSSPSPPAFNLSQHQGLFQWVGSSHQVAKVLELKLQHQSFQWIQCWFPLGLTGLISLLSKGLSRVFSSNTVQKHQFFGTQLSLWSSSDIHTWLLEKPQLWLDRTLLAK